MSNTDALNMIKLLDFYRQHGYPMNGAAYQRITNRIASGEYPVYAPSKKIRYITPEVGDQILKEVPPPASDVEVAEDMESGEETTQAQSSEDEFGTQSELRALRDEIAGLRGAVVALTEAMKR
ncbi:hypothetical protein OG210_21935 [Streptomyces sp. NBC_00466]|uniref:hypothetical protein n=1 Tax=Streptomyces sp. NBC_00466 TaxID=2903655 RepID=UPI0030E2CC5A